MKYLILFSLLLSGCCGQAPLPPDPIPVIVPVSCEKFGRIEPVQRLPVVFVKAVDDKGNNVLGLRGDQYSNLSLIIRDSLRYIGEQKKAISYYEKCIDDHNAKAQ